MPELTTPTMSRAPQQSAAPDKPKLVEVELRRKYCPHWIVNSDGTIAEQDSNGKAPLQYINPGIVRLHPQDASIVLRSTNGVAVPTGETWKDL